MKLLEDWDAILKKAWSVKFSIAAALFGGLEVAVQYVKPASIPAGAFAAVAAVISILATGARVLQQQELSGGGNGTSSQ